VGSDGIEVVRMAKTAFLFPGQGAQYEGMGRALAEAFPSARAVFDEANDALGLDIAKLCFEGGADELSQTANCQPAIFVTSMAALRVMRERGESVFADCCAMAGLSLGEYTALVAADAMSFDDGVRLVRKRGELMQQAGEMHEGCMASVLGLSDEAVEQVCQAASADGTVVAANYNCPGQLVISGEPTALGKAQELAKEAGAKRVIPLNVSGAFHSPLMAPAAEALQEELNRVEISRPSVPIVANVTADYVTDSDEIRRLLVQQLTRPVRWTGAMQRLVADGVEMCYEIGPGKVLAGLMRRIDRQKPVVNLDGPDSFDQLQER